MTKPDNRRHRTAALWTAVHGERAALTRDLADLPEDRWATPSLCAGLTVREVLAHITAAANLNTPRWFAGVVRCRFDFDRQVTFRLRQHLGADPAETLDRFRAIETSTVKPPLPVIAMLGETLVHGEDIRRPLGLSRPQPIASWTRLLDYYCGSDYLMPVRKRTVGLRLAATDGPFASGSGPLVTGTTTALTMAVSGRAVYFDELGGDGVTVLRQRCENLR